jgi:DNA-binding MarR family transcriptional regulator
MTTADAPAAAMTRAPDAGAATAGGDNRSQGLVTRDRLDRVAERTSGMGASGPTRPEVREAVVLMQRYTTEITHAVGGVLGNSATGNTDIGILLMVNRRPGLSAGALPAMLGSPRSTVARGISRLADKGFIQRRANAQDRRRVELRLTARGHQSIEVLARVLDSYFRDGEPLVKEIAHLLGIRPGPPEDPGASTLDLVSGLARAGEAVAGEAAGVCDRFGITEWVDRAALVLVSSGERRPTELAAALLLSPTGTSSLLDRLTRQALVERVGGEHLSDGRAVIVRATPRGVEAADALIAAYEPHLDSLVGALWLTTGRS